jgi:hypothetical protein
MIVLISGMIVVLSVVLRLAISPPMLPVVSMAKNTSAIWMSVANTSVSSVGSGSPPYGTRK